MKKHLISLPVIILLLLLSGCGNTVSDTQGDDKILLQTIDQLSKINSYELTTTRSESAAFGDKRSISQTITDQKIIFEPFVNWSRTDSTSTRIYEGAQYRTLREAYQVFNDGKLNLFIRYSSAADVTKGNEPVLGKWEKVSASTKEQANWTIEAARNNFDAQLYLLKSNIDSFKTAENEDKDENILQYNGYLGQDTILKAYQKYVRGLFVKGKLLKDSKSMTLENLKNEITEGNLYEIKEGIPKLAYSEKPVPISLWIDKSTFELKKVTIDETLVMQSYMEKEIPKANPDLKNPIVSKASLIYEIKNVDNIKKIPMPD